VEPHSETRQPSEGGQGTPTSQPKSGAASQPNATQGRQESRRSRRRPETVGSALCRDKRPSAQVASVIITVLGAAQKLKKGRAAAVLVFLLMACQAQAGVIPKYDFTASALVVHDLASGYRHPYITITQIVLGPHYGPFYIGGAGLAEIPGVGMVIPYCTYVDAGKFFNGKLKGATVSVGKFPGSLHGTYVGLGFSR
jgi:hypothetical protein